MKNIFRKLISRFGYLKCSKSPVIVKMKTRQSFQWTAVLKIPIIVFYRGAYIYMLYLLAVK